jgi:protein-arginine kinase activator protein McsA
MNKGQMMNTKLQGYQSKIEDIDIEISELTSEMDSATERGEKEYAASIKREIDELKTKRRALNAKTKRYHP